MDNDLGRKGFRVRLPKPSIPVEPWRPSIPPGPSRADMQKIVESIRNVQVDPTPGVVAANTGRTADAIDQLVELTLLNIQLAEGTEKFTRRMSWASLIISLGSLAAAIAAIVLSVVLR